MSHPLVVNKRKDPFDVYIGRGSKWGNPFTVGKDGTREEALVFYRRYIETDPELYSQIPELKGKILGCFCAPLPCHGDILAEIANKEDRSRAAPWPPPPKEPANA